MRRVIWWISFKFDQGGPEVRSMSLSLGDATHTHTHTHTNLPQRAADAELQRMTTAMTTVVKR